MTCPNCAAPVGATDASCPSCAAMLAFTVPDAAQPVPHGLYANRPVRSVRGVGMAAMILVGLAALGSVADAVATAMVGGGAGVADVSALLLVVSAVSMLASGLWLAATVLRIIWLWQVRKNLDAFVGASPRWRSGWAIGAWFIPLANLVLLPLVIADVARNTLAGESARRVVRVVWTWAVLQILGTASAFGAFAILALSSDPSTILADLVALDWMTAVIMLGEALMVIGYTNLITKGQQARIPAAPAGTLPSGALSAGPPLGWAPASGPGLGPVEAQVRT